MTHLQVFTKDYLDTAYWVVDDFDFNADFSEEAKNIAENDCKMFIEKVLQEFGDEKGNQIIRKEGKDLNYRTAHDFYLTRNRHGAGFWDNPKTYGGQDIADKLTEIAESMGENNAYPVDDQLIEFETNTTK